MPGVIEAITFLVISAQAGALGAGLTAVLGTFGTGLIGAAVSVGISLLSAGLFQPKQPKPEDVQTSVKNPTAPRQRHYGRVKTSGPWVFAETKSSTLYKVIALGTGLLDAIEEFWIDDNIATIDGSGWVTSDPYENDGDSRVRLQHRLGAASQTHYSDLTAAFPEWDSTHKGNGVSSLFITQLGADPEDINDFFPNLANTQYRVVARGSRVFNPSTGTTVWSDNGAAVIRDYMTHADGMRLPASLFTTTQAAAGWLAAYERAAVAVEKKAGGTEDAYRLWGSYAFDERPADVLGRMLACCDGRVVPTPDGGITLDIGTWEEPSVTIDADSIVGFSELSRGRDIQSTANTIRATYLSPTHDYQATDADPWVDEDDISARGEIAADKSFNMSPSHGQARRLMKLEAYRATPKWVGTFQCNLKALAAFGKRFVRIEYPLFGIDDVFEIIDFRFNIGEGGILLGVTLTGYTMPAEAYEWDAATEEGTEPISEDVVVDRTIPLPQNFAFVVDRIQIGSQLVPFGVISFDEPPSPSLIIEGRYRKVGAASWQVVAVDDDSTSAQTGALEDGEDYEAQVRHITVTGRVGDWTPSETVSVVADTTAPGPVSDVLGTGGVGEVDLSWRAPNSANFVAVNIYRNTVNNVGTAVLVHTEYGPASNSDAYTDSALSAGTYYYWLAARNGSGIEAAKVATGAVTVT
jgi:hypothetical protein